MKLPFKPSNRPPTPVEVCTGARKSRNKSRNGMFTVNAVTFATRHRDP